MKRVRAFAPCRIDLAGGTLDIPPLNILVPSAVTVNLAINIGAEVEVADSQDRASHITIEDKGLNFSINPGEPYDMPAGAELVNSVHGYYFDRYQRPLKITTRTTSPPGAGLAASSALCVALVSALNAFFKRQMSRLELVRLCLDLEARVLGTPAGYQDFVAAIYGGLSIIKYPAGSLDVETVDFESGVFERHAMLVYTGKPHHSGLNNWEVFKGYIEGIAKTRSALSSIGTVARRMASELKAGRLGGMAVLLSDEWRLRKALSPVVSNKTIDELVKKATESGGAAKVCGAGGGGCVLVWHDGELGTLKKLRQEIEALGCMVLDFKPVFSGCEASEL